MAKTAMTAATMLGAATFAGYMYLRKNPEMMNSMKKKTKEMAKKVYDMLDDMD